MSPSNARKTTLHHVVVPGLVCGEFWVLRLERERSASEKVAGVREIWWYLVNIADI